MRHFNLASIVLVTLAACGGNGFRLVPPDDADTGTAAADAVAVTNDSTAVQPDVTTVTDSTVAIDDAPVDASVRIDAPPTDTMTDTVTVQPDAVADTVVIVVPDGSTSACHADSDCAAPRGVCDPASQHCVACLSATDCGASQACVLSECIAAVSCVSSRTCNGLVCNTGAGRCVECLTDPDCSDGRRCHANSCVLPPPACGSDRDCSTRAQVCDPVQSVCVDCVRGADCNTGQFCNADHRCRAQVCVPDSTSCVGTTTVHVCDALGAGASEHPCAGGEVCSPDRCVQQVCVPSARHCASSAAYETCNALGLAYESATACPSGQTCSLGQCSVCDNDGDGDDDGLTDILEATLGTDHCSRDSDGDGFTDLVERTAGSDPLVNSSRPFGQQVELPYRIDGTNVTRDLTVTAGQRPIDVFFLIDSTGSLTDELTTFRSSASTIVSQFQTALGASADVRFGVADFRDFGSASTAAATDYTLHRDGPLDATSSALGNALSMLAVGMGGDAPEAFVPALHSLVEGFGASIYHGTATRPVQASDCGGSTTAFGWGCFDPSRRSVVIGYSDAASHNGPGETTNFDSASLASAPLYRDLVASMRRHDVRYVGVDLGSTASFSPISTRLATDTDSFNASGQAPVFTTTVSGSFAGVAQTVAGFAGTGRPSYTGRAVADPLAGAFSGTHTTTEFVQSVLAVRGVPDAPTGYARIDSATTFVQVESGTVLTFRATLANGIVPQGASDQVWSVTVLITGGGYTVERRVFWVVVPAA